MASNTNVFVSNLPKHVDDATLRLYFEPYGVISSSKVMIDKITGQSRGTGFVQYRDPMAAASAIVQLNGALVDGNTVVVKAADHNAGAKGATRAIARRQSVPTLPNVRVPAATSAPSDNVFVVGLPAEWREGDLNTLFGGCGPIVSSVVLIDRATGRSKGAGMVRFATIGAAALAVKSLNGFVVEGTGRKLDVRFAERPQEKAGRKAAQASLKQMRFSPYPTGGANLPGTPAGGKKLAVPKRTDIPAEEGANLHVFGLDMGLSDLQLYEAFAGYGAVRSVRVVVDTATKNPKGYGFVQFFNAQDAQAAMAALNGIQVGTRTWRITIHQKKA